VANGSDEGIEIVDDALIEAIELRSPLGFDLLSALMGLGDLSLPWSFSEWSPEDASPWILLYSITTSARPTNVAGSSSPSAFAVFRLIASSNLVSW
jgi:hypothetical protein